MRRLVLSLLLYGILPRPGFAQDERPPVPKDARLTLEIDRPRYLLGESILVHLCVENVGTQPFRIELGGDYRGASRHTRFHVLATDARGGEVPDPDPNPMNMGGLGGTREVMPGEKHVESLPLLRYRRFEKAGKYRLRVRHDFGWKERDASKFPSAVAEVEIVEPDEKQARAVVENTYRLPRQTDRTGKQRQEPYADFRTLGYPLYLPLLIPRAVEGCELALEAVAHTPTPEATRKLIRLTGHRHPGFALQAATHLSRRMPDPRLNERKPGPGDHDFDAVRRRFVELSWRADLAPEARRAARALLDRKDHEGLDWGAYLVLCVGGKNEADPVARALTLAATEAAKQKRGDTDFHRWRNACSTLLRASGQLAKRGAAPPEEPKSSGELIVFAAVARNPANRDATFARMMTHPLPFVRETALLRLPDPAPAALQALLPQLIEDADADVSIAACQLAAKWKLPQHREPVVRVLKTAREDWHLDAACEAAEALGLHMERIDTLVARLDEVGMTARCLVRLIPAVIAKTQGYGHRTDLDAETARACKMAWDEFLAERRDALRKGRRYELTDPDFLTVRLFPGFTFEPLR